MPKFRIIAQAPLGTVGSTIMEAPNREVLERAMAAQLEETNQLFQPMYGDRWRAGLIVSVEPIPDDTPLGLEGMPAKPSPATH